jgi:hypothetical protein
LQPVRILEHPLPVDFAQFGIVARRPGRYAPACGNMPASSAAYSRAWPDSTGGIRRPAASTACPSATEAAPFPPLASPPRMCFNPCGTQAEGVSRWQVT